MNIGVKKDTILFHYLLTVLMVHQNNRWKMKKVTMRTCPTWSQSFCPVLQSCALRCRPAPCLPGDLQPGTERPRPAPTRRTAVRHVVIQF